MPAFCLGEFSDELPYLIEASWLLVLSGFRLTVVVLLE